MPGKASGIQHAYLAELQTDRRVCTRSGSGFGGGFRCGDVCDSSLGEVLSASRVNTMSQQPDVRCAAPSRFGGRGLQSPLALLILCSGLAVAAPAMAQQSGQNSGVAPKLPEKDAITAPPKELQAFEGRLIRSIITRRGGVAGAAPEPLDAELDTLLRNQMRTKAGGAYQQEVITEDITRLNRLGRFRQVENRVQLLDDGSVDLIFTVEPQPVVQDVQVVGNKRLTDQDIAREVDIIVGTPADPLQLERSARRIEDLYRKKGYYLAQVTVDKEELDKTNIVLFRVREGERIRVVDIRFEGNNTFSRDELRTNIKTKIAWLLERAPLDDDVLESDVAEVIKYYRDRGYLDVRADKVVRPSPDGREAIVTFVVDEGRQYTLRSVEAYYPEMARVYGSMEEAKRNAEPGEKILPMGLKEVAVYRYGAFTAEQIKGLMLIKPGDAYSVDKLEKSTEAIRAALGKLGYSSAIQAPGVGSNAVRRRELRDPEKPEVDLLLLIDQGKQYKTGEVIVRGNDLTKQEVVLRQVQVLPDRPLDAIKLEESEKRLQNINLFDRRSVKVTAQQPDEVESDRRDVLVEVSETNTGKFSLGAAVGSDSGVTGRIALEQRNFDIRDWPDTFDEAFSGRAFRGGGQTFTIEALPGDKTQSFQLGLSEPYLLETDYSGSASVYYRRRDYREYNEQRIGMQLGAGRRFGERWTATIPLRVEDVDLSDVEPSQPEDYFESSGGKLMLSTGLTLTRSTLDNLVMPSKGTKITLGVQQYGLGIGDYDFTVFNGEHSIYLTVNEDFLGAKTVLNLNTKVSYIPQGQSNVPVFERFYLGGSGMRGFAYRTVSPRGRSNDTKQPNLDDPIGGTFLFFWGAELKQPIYEDIISVVTFLDTGTVTTDASFKDYRAAVGFGLRLYVRDLSPAPLAFDFGFPIKKVEGDRKRLFTFNIDLPF